MVTASINSINLFNLINSVNHIAMKKRNKTGWKELTAAQEKKIIADFEAGRVSRAKILIEYDIPTGQFYHIIKKTARM